MSEHTVGKQSELDDGDRLVVELEGRDVAVFNVDGEYYAYTNWCAHQGGPVCEGQTTGRKEATFDRETLETELNWVREGEILTCPWHAWEYDLVSGECKSRNGIQLISHQVEVRGEDLVVSV